MGNEKPAAAGVYKQEFTNRELVALIAPLVAEQFLAILVGLADSLMVATVGDAAISAVSLVDSISNLMIYVFSAMAAGGAAVAGQYIGRREQENANAAGQHLVLLLAVASAFFISLLYLFKTAVLTTVFGQIDADVMAATDKYYTIVMASIPGIALYNGGAAIFRTMGKSKVSLKVSLLMNGINVTGNAILIFGCPMDVAGVAIPTLPSGIENGMFQLGRLMLFSLISTFGTASIVANAIGNTLGNFHCFAGQALNLGMTTVVSQCVGAGDHDGARYYLRKLMKAGYVLMAAVNLTIIALLPLIMRIYDVSPEGERLAVIIALIHGIASIVLWLPSFSFPTFLRAAGDARFTMLASMTSMWLCRVMFAYIFGKFMGFGVVGVWVAHAILDWTVRSTVFYARYRSNKWTTKAIS